MRGRKPDKLRVKAKDKTSLRELVHDGQTPLRVARRAQILLSRAEDQHQVGLLSETVRQTSTTIWRVCERYRQAGLPAALYDAPRSGRPRVFSSRDRKQIERLRCREPSSVGWHVTHWSHRSLAQAVGEQASKRERPTMVAFNHFSTAVYSRCPQPRRRILVEPIAQGEPMHIKQEIYDAVVDGNADLVERLIPEALAAGVPATELLQEGLIAAMAEVGDRFECGQYFVPEMLISAEAMLVGMKHLRPLLVAQDVKPIGRVVIGTVKGDLHDIGKNLVAMMLEGAGFQVIDLGVDVPAERFVQAAQHHNADLVALSALLTTTMPSMQQVVTALKEARLAGRVKTIIGGAPITQTFADRIGADGFAPDAGGAANRARQLIDAH